jgi:hypothetical protein
MRWIRVFAVADRTLTETSAALFLEGRRFYLRIEISVMGMSKS